MSNTVRQQFTGTEELSRVLMGIPAAVRLEILEPAVRKGAQPIRRAAVTFAPRLTGALKKSIAVKVVSNKQKGTAAAIIGPDRDYYQGGKRLAKNADRRGSDRPANYAHLVEFGHVVVAPKKGTSLRRGSASATGYVQPQPFMRPAVIAGAPQAEAIIAAELNAGIERARAKHVRSA